MLLARFTEESNEQKSENQTLKFQASNLTFGIVPLSTLWLKTLFLLLSHIIKLDLEAFPFLIRFCPVLLLKKYFALNTSFFLPVTSIIPVPPLLFLLHPLVATEISRSCCVRCPKSQKNHTQDFYTSDPIFSLWVIELLKISCTMQSKSSFSVGSIDYSPLWQHFLGLLRGDAHFFQLHCVFLISFWMLWGHWIFTESFIKLNSTSRFTFTGQFAAWLFPALCLLFSLLCHSVSKRFHYVVFSPLLYCLVLAGRLSHAAEITLTP